MSDLKLKKLEDMIDYNSEHFEKITLLDNHLNAAMLFALKKGQSLPKHTSPVNAFVYVLEGEINFVLYKSADSCCDSCMCTVSSSMQEQSDAVEIKTVSIKKDEIFLFEKDVFHSVLAKKDTKMLVVRI